MPRWFSTEIAPSRGQRAKLMGVSARNTIRALTRADDSRVQLKQLLRLSFPIERVDNQLSSTPAHLSGLRRVLEHPLDRRCYRGDIARWNAQAATVPLHDFAPSGKIRGDHRQAGRHVFE